MLKQAISALLFTTATFVAFGQSMQGEWWLDGDINNRASSSMQGDVLNIDIDLSSLCPGIHSLCYRFRDNSGNWSAPGTAHIVKPQAAPGTKITGGEWWLDGNINNRTAASMQGDVLNIDIDLSSLCPGIHSLYYRFRDNSGNWSAPGAAHFVKPQDLPGTKAARYEYWLDRNIKHRSSGTMQDGVLSLDIDVALLGAGIHSLHYRIMDDAGKWTAPESRYFIKPEPRKTDNRITAYQYWFNYDLSTKTDIAIDNPLESPWTLERMIDIRDLDTPLTPDNVRMITKPDRSIQITSANTLHLRFRDANNEWSKAIVDTFYIDEDSEVIDFSRFIVNPDAMQQASGWTFSPRNNAPKATANHYSGNGGSYFHFSRYASSGSVSSMSQTVANLPPGTYILSAIARSDAGTQVEISVDGIGETFPAIGDTGGEIWEDAEPDSPARNVNGGKGGGWNRRSVVFASNGSPVTISVKGDIMSGNTNHWFDITDFDLKMNNSAVLTAKFPTVGIISSFKGMKLVLSSAKNEIVRTVSPDKTEYRFSGLSRNANHSLTLQDSRGYVAFCKNPLILSGNSNEIILDPLPALENIRLDVTTPEGIDVSDKCRVDWYSIDGERIVASGRTIEAVPATAETAYRIILSDSLANIYSEPAEPIKATAQGGVLNHRLVPLRKRVVTGFVCGDFVPRSDATIRLSRPAADRILFEETKTDRNGRFAIPFAGDSCTLVVSSPDYIDYVADLHMDADTTDIGTVELQRLSGSVVIPHVKMKLTGSDEIEPLYNLGNIGFTVNNLTSTTDSVEYHIVSDRIVIPLSEPGNRLSLTVSSLDNSFANTTFDISIPQSDTLDIDLPVVQLGSLEVRYPTIGEPGDIAMLYDRSGNLVRKSYFASETLSFDKLEAGAYSLVTMAANDMFDGAASIAVFEDAGLVAGSDYIDSFVEIADGRVATAEITRIPPLDAERFLFTCGNTSLLAGKSNVSPGEYVTLTAKIELKPEFKEEIDRLSLVIDLPENCEYIDNSAIIGTVPATISADDNRLSVELDSDDLKERIRLCVTTVATGTSTISGAIEFTLGDKIAQPIGSVVLETKPMSIDAPERTSLATIDIRGKALPSATVEITDNGTAIGRCTASLDGSWCARCTLADAYNNSVHNVKAAAVLKDGRKAESECKSILYSRNIIEPLTAKVYYRNRLSATFDFRNVVNHAPSYSFVPGAPSFSFAVRFNDNSPEKLSNVKVLVKTTKNDVVPLDAVYSQKDDNWVATGKFTSTRLPVNVGVQYISLGDTVLVDSAVLEEAVGMPEKVVAELDSLDRAFNQLLAELEALSAGGVCPPSAALGALDRFYPVAADGASDSSPLPSDVVAAIDALATATDDAAADRAWAALQAANARHWPTTIGSDYSPDDFSAPDGSTTVASGGYSVSKRPTGPSDTPTGLRNQGYTELKAEDGGRVFVRTDGAESTVVDLQSGSKTTVKSASAAIIANAETYEEILALLHDQATTNGENISTAVSAALTEAGKAMGDKAAAFNKEYAAIYARVMNYPGPISRKTSIALGKLGKEARFYNSADRWLKGYSAYMVGVGGYLEYQKQKRHGNALDELYARAERCAPDVQLPYIKDRIDRLKRDQAWERVRNTSADALISGVEMALLGSGVFTGGVGFVVAGGVFVVHNLVVGAFKSSTEITYQRELNDILGLVDWSNCDPSKPRDTDPLTDGYATAWARNPDMRPSIDPAGYVYEAVASRRLQGVAATAYCRTTAVNIYGDTYEKTEVWNAEEYSQLNPLITDADGVYAWDVPPGLWQVRFEKTGYEPAASEWLPVPPPQLEVNIGMRRADAPCVETVRGYESGIAIVFDRHMVPASITADSVTVSAADGTRVRCAVVATDLETAPGTDRAYASRYRLTPPSPFAVGDTVGVDISSGATSYAGTPMAARWCGKVVIEPEVKAIVTDSLVKVDFGASRQLTVRAEPAEASRGKVLRATSDGSPIFALDEASAAGLRLDADGCATLTLEGLMPGTASLALSIDGSECTAAAEVTVELPQTKALRPGASIRGGSLVAPGTPVALSTPTEGAAIYYTLDGSCPCDAANRFEYTEPIVIDRDVTILAQAEKEGLEPSDVSRFAYTVDSSGVTEIGSNPGVRAMAEGLLIEGCKGAECQVYDTAGRLLFSTDALPESFVLSLPRGTACIVRVANGAVVTVDKVVVH